MGGEVPEDVGRTWNREEAMIQMLDLKKQCLPTSEEVMVSEWIQKGGRGFQYPFSKVFPPRLLCLGTTHRFPTIHSPKHFSAAV